MNMYAKIFMMKTNESYHMFICSVWQYIESLNVSIKSDKTPVFPIICNILVVKHKSLVTFAIYNNNNEQNVYRININFR